MIIFIHQANDTNTKTTFKDYNTCNCFVLASTVAATENSKMRHVWRSIIISISEQLRFCYTTKLTTCLKIVLLFGVIGRLNLRIINSGIQHTALCTPLQGAATLRI